jgi:hypothetical protein
MLGYGGNEDWRDMSEYVVHLTHRGALRKILSEGALEARNPMGTARNLHQLGDSQQAVCLSEIPLDRLDRLVERHGRYGVGFRKTFIRREGGTPVWYLWRDTLIADAFQTLVTDAMRGGVDPEDRLWQVTPFVENPGSGPWGRYEFDWEREWRVVGDLVFAPADVAFLIIPEGEYSEMTEEVEWFFDDYSPAVIDLTWPLPKLQQVLAEYELSEDEVV